MAIRSVNLEGYIHSKSPLGRIVNGSVWFQKVRDLGVVDGIFLR